VDERFRESADRVRSSIMQGICGPAQFRAALMDVPFVDREVWVDAVFGLDELPEDGPELPSGCVPYLPCAVDVLLRLVDNVPFHSTDVFVDIGAGVGRAAALVHLLAGVSCVGIEVQSKHIDAARGLALRLGLSRVTFVSGDALQLPEQFSAGSVFFLYCPFSGERLVKMLGHFESIARERLIYICAVDLPLPPCAWLERMELEDRDLAVYRSKTFAG
jgi:SAM-dependent methyltransferase